MSTAAVIIARMGSTRLPGKVLMDLAGKPVLAWVVDAARAAPGIDGVWVATSILPADDKIEKWAWSYGLPVYRGSETDVLARFTGAAQVSGADVVVRLTGDCPFLDPQVIGAVVRLQQETHADYVSNIDPPTWPDGLDCEAVTLKALIQAEREAFRPIDRETVTQYIARNRSRFPAACVTAPLPGLYRERWVLDTENDLAFCRAVADALGKPPRNAYVAPGATP